MKKVLFLLGIILSLSPCKATHYFSTISSSDTKLKKTESGILIFENDTLSISYSFHGKDAPIQISIYNKTNEPLYIDWQRSAIIIDKIATSYNKQKMKIEGGLYTNTTNINNYFSETSGSFSGVATLPKHISFIPPQSGIDHSSLKISDTNFNYNAISKNKKIGPWTKKVIRAKGSNKPTDLYSVSLNEADSPLKFRSYLSLYLGEKMSPMPIDVSFYLSDVTKSDKIPPSNMIKGDFSRDDSFYIKK